MNKMFCGSLSGFLSGIDDSRKRLFHENFAKGGIMAEKERKKGTLAQIFVPVAVALLVGTSSPWWLKYFSSNEVPVPGPGANGSTDPPGSHQPPSILGTLTVTATADPPVVRQGQQTTITTFVQDSQGHPVSGALVSLDAGGGRFRTTGTSSVAGKTDVSGIYRATWWCNQCAPGYVSGVRVTKQGFTETRDQWRVSIQ
jgi:hypothetical protein